MQTENYEGHRAVIYARISRDSTKLGQGVERQEKECRRYAESQGMEVVEILKDNDTSAYSGRRRPGYERLLAMVEDREVNAVIYWKPDRLSRNAVELLTFIELAASKGITDTGVTLHTSDGPVDTTSAGGGLSTGLAAMIAQYESTLRSERISLKYRQSAEANEWAGGPRPLGWNINGKHLEVNEREASAIRQAAEDALSGKSMGSIVREWNDPDRPGGPMRSSQGREFEVGGLKKVLLRTRNYGEVEVKLKDGKGSVVTTSPPIMSRELFESVKRLLTDPSRRTQKTNKARYLLSGIAQCHCGEPVKVGHAWNEPDKHGNRTRRTFYKCPASGQGHISKRVQYVDTVVELFVFRALIEDIHAHGNKPEVLEEVNTLRITWGQLQEEKAEGGELLGSGKLNLEQLGRYNQAIDARIQEVELQLDALEQPALDEPLGDVAQVLRDHKQNDAAFRQWRRMPIDDRREWMRRRFYVILRPHTSGPTWKFDTETVSVYPRQLGEYGDKLSAEVIQQRPLTPVMNEGPPPSMQNLYAGEGEKQVTESWNDYFNAFAMSSGFGWMDGLGIDPTVADSRTEWQRHWKEPEQKPLKDV